MGASGEIGLLGSLFTMGHADEICAGITLSDITSTGDGGNLSLHDIDICVCTSHVYCSCCDTRGGGDELSVVMCCDWFML